MVELASSSNTSSSSGFVQKDMAGTYAYRFSGFTVAYNIVYRLAGLGQMQIDENGTIRGKQRSAITPLGGQAARLKRSIYRLDGKIALESDGTGSARIRFGLVTGDGVDVDGHFDVQVAGGPGRLWFLSSGSTLPNAADTPADEHVELEAIRLDKP
jgi:hypothetical protein